MRKICLAILILFATIQVAEAGPVRKAVKLPVKVVKKVLDKAEDLAKLPVKAVKKVVK